MLLSYSFTFVFFSDIAVKYYTFGFYLLVCIIILLLIGRHASINEQKQQTLKTMNWLMQNRYLTQFVNISSDNSSIRTIQPIDVCSDKINGVLIVYFVTSSPKNRAGRNVIRATWGKDLNPKPIFFLGTTDNSDVMDMIVAEADEFNDIIIENFHDSYSNLTIKVCCMLRDFTKICPNAKFMMKIDDDMYLNPELVDKILLKHLSQPIEQRPDLIGKKYDKVLPIRRLSSKWYTPKWLYEDNYFPSYLSGPAYIIAGHAVSQMYNKSLELPILPIEDVMFTGIVANKHLNMKLLNDDRFMDDKPFSSKYCYYKDIATAHRLTTNELTTIWNEKSRNRTNCIFGWF